VDSHIQQKCRETIQQLTSCCADRLDLLTAEMELLGPVRHNWKHYSKLEGRKRQYHCHIKTGKPTYVAVWEEVDNIIKLIEVIYAGTNEKAPY
jgi:hypothetical protein